MDTVKNAPKPIIIDSVQTQKLSARVTFKNFRIKTGPLADEMQEGFGSIEMQFTDYRSEFRSFAESKRRYAGQGSRKNVSGKFAVKGSKVEQLLANG